jgi:PII-like signaling protein
MSHSFKGERTLMRIFIGESDKYQGKPLYEALVETLRAKGLAGATVLRGVAGFGASSTVHTDKILRLSLDLPLIIEIVETEEAIQSILPVLDEMIGGGLITLERARVIMYRPANVRPNQRELHRIEGLEPDCKNRAVGITPTARSHYAFLP